MATYIVLSFDLWLLHSHVHLHVGVLHVHLSSVGVHLVLGCSCHLLALHRKPHLLLVFWTHLGHLCCKSCLLAVHGRLTAIVSMLHLLTISGMHSCFHLDRRLLRLSWVHFFLFLWLVRFVG